MVKLLLAVTRSYILGHETIRQPMAVGLQSCHREVVVRQRELASGIDLNEV
jgi:hypothetical protein